MGEWRGKVGHVSTCLTQEEKDIVYDKIELSGLMVHEYMARCLTEKEIWVIKDLSNFTDVLKKIGHQLDYLIYLSEKNELGFADELRNLSEMLEDAWNRLGSYIKEVEEHG